MSNITTTIVAACFLGLFCGDANKSPSLDAAPEHVSPVYEQPSLAPPPPPDSALQKISIIAPEAGEPLGRSLTDPFDGSSIAGNYLSSVFAQRRHNWSDAYTFLKTVMDNAPEDLMLQKRGMILAMGAGDFDTAINLAEKANTSEENSTLAQLFIAVDAFEKGDHKHVTELVTAMQESSISQFLLPLLESWNEAAQGKNDIKALTHNSMHLYHAILISDYLGDKNKIEHLLDRAVNAPGLQLQDNLRIADLYAHIGNIEAAKDIYLSLIANDPKQSDILARKIEALNKGEIAKVFDKPNNASQGLAEALYDMARILYDDFNDDSARIFVNMALHLYPDFDNAKLLMGHITARNNQPREAIEFYKSVSIDSDIFVRARRRAADIMEEIGDENGALQQLAMLAETRNDLDALIQMGDIYRRNNDYTSALARYNQARQKLGGQINEKFWHLHYVSGVAYERMGEWNKAEKELQAALQFRPNNPLVLNYLGYGWADQGVNLQQSLSMLRKAAALEPDDGYISDSLGWVLYKSGQHKEAVPYLEKASELLPYDPVINDHLGDAYWRTGRRLEARFQWRRALSNIPTSSEEELTLKPEISQKLQSGMGPFKVIQEAVMEQHVDATEHVDQVTH